MMSFANRFPNAPQPRRDGCALAALPREPRAARPQGGWMQRAQAVAGLPARVRLWADDRARGAAAMTAVMTELQRVGQRFGAARPDGELARVNAAAATAAVPVGGELFQLLARAQAMSSLTGGAFDITAASAAALHERGAGGPVDDIGLARAVQAVGWRHLRLDPSGPSVRFDRPGLRIGMGSFARAWAVEQGRSRLARLGIRQALITFGGSWALLGDGLGAPWPAAAVGLDDALAAPDAPPLAGLAGWTIAATARAGAAGAAGRRPLIDPRTGRPCALPQRVVVFAADGLLASALGKAVCVLGVERGLRLVQAQRGAHAWAVDADGHRHATYGTAPSSAAMAMQALA